MPKLIRKKKGDRSSSPALAAAFELHRQGRLDEAEVGYRQVLKDHPANWQGLHQLGEIHLARGQYVEALQFIGAAMKANSASPEAASNYGFVLRHLKRDGEGIAYFDRALILRPGYVRRCSRAALRCTGSGGAKKRSKVSIAPSNSIRKMPRRIIIAPTYCMS